MLNMLVILCLLSINKPTGKFKKHKGEKKKESTSLLVKEKGNINGSDLWGSSYSGEDGSQ